MRDDDLGEHDDREDRDQDHRDAVPLEQVHRRVERHADAAGPGQDVVLVFMEALELEPRVTFCTIFFPNLELVIDEFSRNSSVEISTFTQINPLPKTKKVVH